MPLSVNKDFIQLIREEMARMPSPECVFGFSREGEYVGSWLADLERIDRATRDTRWVRITVGETETGVKPEGAWERSFGWTGKINEYAAETALWWAFDLLTESEAREFMKTHRPVVQFDYAQRSRCHRISVRYDGLKWVVIDQS